MHPKNIHNEAYNFEALIAKHQPLEEFVFTNTHNTETIDFSKNDAVFHLNKALLKTHYNVTNWDLPKGYLCPPIPSRADYLHYIADLISETKTDKTIKGLDIGVGANCIYPILGAQIYKWHMVGCDINLNAIESAQHNVNLTKSLKKHIEIRHQESNANIFEGIIKTDEHFDFTMCNPPFHTSEEEATKGSMRKLKNLKYNHSSHLNFGGQANELWCNGGEALFIKRMIKQSKNFKNQVDWFTTLVSKKESLPKLIKLLEKLNTNYKIINMTQGNKKSRILAWSYSN